LLEFSTTLTWNWRGNGMIAQNDSSVMVGKCRSTGCS
jgi:hypothetical protein